jgi:hypothetical protein
MDLTGCEDKDWNYLSFSLSSSDWILENMAMNLWFLKRLEKGAEISRLVESFS